MYLVDSAVQDLDQPISFCQWHKTLTIQHIEKIKTQLPSSHPHHTNVHFSLAPNYHSYFSTILEWLHQERSSTTGEDEEVVLGVH